jgi:hypothetical protein
MSCENIALEKGSIVLVTENEGFIVFNFCGALLDRGYKVRHGAVFPETFGLGGTCKYVERNYHLYWRF